MQKQQKLSPEKYIIKKGGELPFHECYIKETWKEDGMATVLISKKMPSGKLIVALYLVDTYCLGIKNTLFKFAIGDIDYADFVEKLDQQHALVKCDLNFAHSLIFGAIDYAEDLGFQPNKDFKITKHLLDTDLIDDRINEIEFGKDGKPLFVAGPNDNINRVIGILDKNVGNGNYTHVLPG
jgi:hypothetical protein